MTEEECVRAVQEQKDRIEQMKVDMAAFRGTYLFKRYGHRIDTSCLWDQILDEEYRTLIRLRAKLCEVRGE